MVQMDYFSVKGAVGDFMCVQMDYFSVKGAVGDFMECRWIILV